MSPADPAWQTHQCVIIGSGASALRAAVTCLEGGLTPLLVSKLPVGHSHSLIAEGGVNAALGTLDDDSWKRHFEDTIHAGRQLNHPRLVELLCREAPERLRDLYRYGAGFPTDAYDQIIQSSAGSGGQHRKRVIAVSDFIGFVFQRALLKRALEGGLKVLDDAICVELLAGPSEEICGALVYDLRRQILIGIRSSRILIATGGAGQLYRTTTNTLDATGEGYLLAYDRGAALRDMEMVQFHPTSLAGPPAGRGLLITEAARGIGGVLRNSQGERFMKRYSPAEMELAPRDTVARAIHSEIQDGRGTPDGGVWLDLSQVNPGLVAERLQNTYRLVSQYQNVDLTRSPIEVAPAAHHIMGGVVPQNESMECHDGLFVAGEVAWGVHGANRVGGNALAETQVFGHRAALAMIGKTCRTRPYQTRVVDLPPCMSVVGPKGAPEAAPVAVIRQRLQQVMSASVGLRRSETGMTAALASLETLQRLQQMAPPAPHYYGLAEKIECHYMLRLASLVTTAAIHRCESRGAHWRVDWPAEDELALSTELKRGMPVSSPSPL